MARGRRRGGEAGARGGPHGDGFGDQGDLLADQGLDEKPEDEPDEREAHVVQDGESEGEEANAVWAAAEEPEMADEEATAAPESTIPDEGPAMADEGSPGLSASQSRALEEARALADDGQVERAVDRVREVVEADPESLPLLVGVIEVLGHLARFDDAEEYVKRAQRLAPEDPAIRTAVGILLFRRGLYARAEVELRPVCDGDCEHATAHYYRGEALNRLGRVDEALEVLGRAIELEPDDVRPYHTLGRLYDRKNQPEDAARMYRRARELTGS